MILRAAILLVASALACLGQTPTGAWVDTNGWQLKIVIPGLGTNGTYNLGWPTNAQPFDGGPRVRLQIDSPGHTIDGTPTTRTRMAYGGERLRFPYPGEAFGLDTVHGSATAITVSLTEYVFAGDSNLVVDIDAGLYTQGGTNSASVTSLSVTNLSALAWPKAVIKPTWPDRQRETNATMRIRLMGGHGIRPWPITSDQIGRPLAAVQVIASDLFGNSVSMTQSNLVIDTTLPDIFPTAEYVFDVPISTFTNGSPIRVDYKAFPLLGDDSACFATTNNLYTGHSALPKALTNLCDRLNTYSDVYAIVDPAGDDSTGTTTTSAGWSSHANYFRTWGRAAAAVRTNNDSAHGHDDVGGGVILVRQGSYSIFGTNSYGTNPLARLTFTRYPGDNQWIITNRAGDQDISDRLLVQGGRVEGGGSASAINWNAINELWFDNCTISNANSAAFVQACPNVWITHSSIEHVAQGIVPFAGQNTAYQLRGVNLDNFTGALQPMTMVASDHPEKEGSGGFQVRNDSSGVVQPPHYVLWYNNRMGGLQQPSTLTWWIGQNTNINGLMIAQNVWAITTNAGSCVFNFGGSTLHHTNAIDWNNIYVGKRAAGFWYNQVGTNVAWRWFISHMNNIMENFGYKADTFTGDGPADGARVGNWPVMWSVGFRGNVHVNANTTGSEAPASFVPEFKGLNSYHPLTAFTNRVDWPQFVDPRSQGNASVTGAGNWRYASTTPTVTQTQTPRDVPLPYDLDGLPRGIWDPPGPYRSGNARRSIVSTP